MAVDKYSKKTYKKSIKINLSKIINLGWEDRENDRAMVFKQHYLF